jgi:hypothetical protein
LQEEIAEKSLFPIIFTGASFNFIGLPLKRKLLFQKMAFHDKNLLVPTIVSNTNGSDSKNLSSVRSREQYND